MTNIALNWPGGRAVEEAQPTLGQRAHPVQGQRVGCKEHMQNPPSSALAGPQSDVKGSRWNSDHFLLQGYETLKPPDHYPVHDIHGKARQAFCGPGEGRIGCITYIRAYCSVTFIFE